MLRLVQDDPQGPLATSAADPQLAGSPAAALGAAPYSLGAES